MTQRAIMIAGELSEDDLADLLECMRTVEQRDTSKKYKTVMIDLEGDPSLEEMAARLERIFPRVDGKPPVFTAMPRKKPS